MGYNSPEWAIGFVGGILHNCVVTGIYSTNAEDACMYQVEHSEAEVILVENNEYLARFNLEKLPRIKAVVIWGESNLASNVKDSRVLLWKDFIKLGQDIKDEIVYEKVSRQKPGECSTLIYTSGTTGMPKGCMLSHDNLCWEFYSCLMVQLLEHLHIHRSYKEYLCIDDKQSLSYNIAMEKKISNIYRRFVCLFDFLPPRLFFVFPPNNLLFLNVI